jgi:hypothetical protein
MIKKLSIDLMKTARAKPSSRQMVAMQFVRWCGSAMLTLETSSRTGSPCEEFEKFVVVDLFN